MKFYLAISIFLLIELRFRQRALFQLWWMFHIGTPFKFKQNLLLMNMIDESPTTLHHNWPKPPNQKDWCWSSLHRKHTSPIARPYPNPKRSDCIQPYEKTCQNQICRGLYVVIISSLYHPNSNTVGYHYQYYFPTNGHRINSSRVNLEDYRQND
jgi:hypothetical protein